MAQVFLRKATSPTVESAYQCATLLWGDMYDNKTESGFTLIGRLHTPDLQNPFFAIAFSVDTLTFSKDDKRYDLLNTDGATRLTHPFTYNIDYERVATSGDHQYVLKDNIFTAVPYGVKPDDFDTLGPYYYYRKNDGQYVPVEVNEAFIPTAYYYKSLSPYSMKFSVIGSGIADFEIICGQWFRQKYQIYRGTNATIYAGCYPDNPDRLSDTYPYGIHKVGSTEGLFRLGSGSQYWWNMSARYDSSTEPPPVGVPKFDGFPVAFTIPSGTVIGSYTTTTEYQCFGVMYVSYDEYGIARSCTIQAMEKKCWVTEKHKSDDFGPDTPAYGGTGKQDVEKDDPINKNMTGAKSGGILGNPTNGAGLVVYKFTESEFTSFMSALYGVTSTPSKSIANFNPLLGITAISNVVESAMSKFTDLDNIVFVKNSPIDFPTKTFNLTKLSIGMLGVNNINGAKVVQDYAVFNKSKSLPYRNPPNDFTDLEPYKTCKLYFPLAGAVDILPSYLNKEDGVTINVRYGYNLLTNAAIYTGSIQTSQGYITFSKEGECARDADVVLTKTGANKAASGLISTAAAGIATIATGGTAAPALATTAAGAATGFLENTTEMSVVNVPGNSTTSPYYECVYGGQTNIFLYSIKTERFTSGEAYTSADEPLAKDKIMGKYSNFYVEKISGIADGAFFSVSDVKLPMAAGMTKAEHDRIVALLMEGVDK